MRGSLLSRLDSVACDITWIKLEIEKSEEKRPIVAWNVDRLFVQSFGSCVAASYGLCLSYFSGGSISIRDVFGAYCRHFGLEGGSEHWEKVGVLWFLFFFFSFFFLP